jgi:hypothetical protein
VEAQLRVYVYQKALLVLGIVAWCQTDPQLFLSVADSEFRYNSFSVKDTKEMYRNVSAGNLYTSFLRVLLDKCGDPFGNISRFTMQL